MTSASADDDDDGFLDTGAQRHLGPLGPVGPLSFGCWRMVGSDTENTRAVHTALDLGMTLIDTADVYGLDWGGSHFGACEEALGRVFASDQGLRSRALVATKAGIVPGVPYVSSARHIGAAARASLSRLGLDYVDLFQVHRPDHFTHPAEVAAAFAQLHREGLARAFGVSNYGTDQIRALLAHTDVPVVSLQPEISVARLDALRDGTLDLCMERDLVPLAWSPLAGGRVATGEGLPAELLSVLDDIARRESVVRSAVAVAFVLAHPSRPVAIVGSQRPDRLTDIATATRVRLSRTDVYRIIQASDGRRLP